MSEDQPELNSFSRAFVDALRAALREKESFGLVDQDEVRGVLTRTQTRDEAAGILQPDAMVSLGYIGTGSMVTASIAVWDRRSSSSFGIKVTSLKVQPAYPDAYVPQLVQSVMKQLDDLSRAPTFKPRNR